MSGEHTHPEVAALDVGLNALAQRVNLLTAQVVSLEASRAAHAARLLALEEAPGFDHDFRGYIGTDWTVPGGFARVPGTRWVADRDGLLLPTVYLNIDYTLDDSPADAVLRIQVMRENPEDATGKYDIVLPKGRTATFDSRVVAGKLWDAGRPAHLQARVLGPVRSCKLYRTSYVAYSVIG
jgi:hypothetical protein